MDAPADLSVEWLGSVDYARGLALQEQAVEARRRGETGDRLLLLEHPAVITLGRSGDETNLLESRESLAGRGVEVHEVGRGGDVTYHAPGQLVGYCIVDLRARPPLDLHRYLRDVEGMLIEALEALGIASRRIDGMTGVYAATAGPCRQAKGAVHTTEPHRKLASIGVGVRHWISYHGFALNVSVDLRGFEAIIPCGLRDVAMSSVARELGEEPAPPSLDARVRAIVGDRFRACFGGQGEAATEP